MWKISGQTVARERFEPFLPVDVLDDYDGPRIFTLKDADGELNLAYWSDGEQGNSRYVVVPTTTKILDSLRAGEISVFDALNQPRCWVCDTSLSGDVGNCWRVDFDSIPRRPSRRPVPCCCQPLNRNLSTSKAEYENWTRTDSASNFGRFTGRSRRSDSCSAKNSWKTCFRRFRMKFAFESPDERFRSRMWRMRWHCRAEAGRRRQHSGNLKARKFIQTAYPASFQSGVWVNPLWVSCGP